jgi:hypothetical protein
MYFAKHVKDDIVVYGSSKGYPSIDRELLNHVPPVGDCAVIEYRMGAVADDPLSGRLHTTYGHEDFPWMWQEVEEAEAVMNAEENERLNNVFIDQQRTAGK